MGSSSRSSAGKTAAKRGPRATAKKPSAKKPAAKKPAAKKPAAKKPSAKKPAAEKPAAKKPAAKKPSAKNPAARAAKAVPKKAAAPKRAATTSAAKKTRREAAPRAGRELRGVVGDPPVEFSFQGQTLELRVEVSSADVAMFEASTAFERGDFGEAVAATTRALGRSQKSSERPGILMARGKALYQLERYEEAIRDFASAIALDPDLRDAHFEKGKAELRAGRHADAEQSFTLDLAGDNPSPISSFNRHSARKALGNVVGALADLDDAVRGLPEVLSIRISRAKLSFQAGRYEQAAADFQSAIALAKAAGDPVDAEWFAGAGLCLGECGRNEEAIREMDQAILHRPEEPIFFCNRGWLHHNAGNLQLAEGDLSRAVAIDPAYAKAYKNRAIVRERSGNLAGAREDLSRLEALGHDVSEELARLGA